MNSSEKLPPLTKGNATDRYEAHKARERDMEYKYAVAADLTIRGNWRRRAQRELAAVMAQEDPNK